MEDITDTDYAHSKRVCKGFKIRRSEDYYGLHVQTNTLMLANVFQNFRNICLQIFDLDPAHFFPHHD